MLMKGSLARVALLRAVPASMNLVEILIRMPMSSFCDFSDSSLHAAAHACTCAHTFFKRFLSLTFQTSVFTLAYGSVSSVRVSSLDPTPEVIKQLLNKYKVGNLFLSSEWLEILKYSSASTVGSWRLTL